MRVWADAGHVSLREITRDHITRALPDQGSDRALLADSFTVAGYHVANPKPDNGDYGVMIASKLQASTDDFGGQVGYLPRIAAITLPAPGGPIHIIGAYIPSEHDFYRQLTDDCGLVDAFRTLHPDTVEHSWVGRTGAGYRYDHAHCTGDLASNHG